MWIDIEKLYIMDCVVGVTWECDKDTLGVALNR